MTQIKPTAASAGLPPVPRAPEKPAVPSAAAAGAARGTSAMKRDEATTGMGAVLRQATPHYQQLAAAVQAKDYAAARQALAQLQPIVEKGDRLAASGQEAELFGRVKAATAMIGEELAKAPQPTQTRVVGVPGRGARAVELPVAPAEAPKGPLSGLGKAASAIGSGLETAAHVVFFPLVAVGKALDPVREAVGGALGGAKKAIDGSIGQVPVIGQAVRFGTGLASSVVGLVDGAVQGVTHPVELAKGLGGMLWTVSGLVPGPRMAWDVAVNGKSPQESLKQAWGEGGQIVQALFQGAIDDVKEGNWSGAAGRLTGDIGSLFLTGGAAAAGKGAAVGSLAGKLGKVGRVVEAARASKVLGTGARLIGGANELSAKIMAAGFKGNFAAWRGAGALAQKLPGVERAMSLVTQGAAKAQPAAAKPQAGVAAVMDRAKQAHSFTPEMLGEVRYDKVGTLDDHLAAQAGVFKQLESTPYFYEGLGDALLEGIVDRSGKFDGAFKGLKLNGKQVSTFEEAASAWQALPPSAPQRAEIAKKLAASMQENFSEALHFPPPTVAFGDLADNLAGLQKEGKVLIDPALLNEDLGYLTHVMAEEHTHAYQRFLADHSDQLNMPKRVSVEVEKYVRDFASENYLSPPSEGVRRFAEGVDQLTKESKNLLDSADEVGFRDLRRELGKKIAPGTPERAMLDEWWAVAKPESERLSFLKYANQDLKTAMKGGQERIWMLDYHERLPRELLEHNGVTRTPAEIQQALEGAIKDSQAKLSAANGKVSKVHTEWLAAYKGQAVEFTAKAVADQLTTWLKGS